MRIFPIAFATIVLSLPTSVLAYSNFWSSNDVDSSTGSQQAAAGEVVTGNSSASSNIKTVIQGNNGGSVHVDIQTESDGVTHHESYTKNVGADGIDVVVATSSHSSGGSTGASTRVVIPARASSSTATTTIDRLRALRPPRLPRFFDATSSHATTSGVHNFPFFGNATGTPTSGALENFFKRFLNLLHLF